MKRDKKIDIRWNQYEIDQINEARGTMPFSEYVRGAALERAIENNDHVGLPQRYENSYGDTRN